ncbi:hypothetical protein SCHPADRAFT_552918 [Schizopora paradoxa]|uniref:Uncharacterized protein n=1 Tax=Schizopora paradoxa TaxID=27342 RepID=A0A0H2RY37_9AGAM|nr:hypothetical protein SCHPADRAFT_552918 [Schizopora paradoxa]
MAPRNWTPHTKRVKGGSHGYNPYARPSCSNERPKPPPLDLIPIVGMVLPDKPMAKKKVRFHQRGPRIEPDDAGIVFPAPAKEPTTPPAHFVAHEDARTPVIGGLGMERFSGVSFTPGVLGQYSYEQLVDRVKGLESMLKDGDETIAMLREQLRSAEKDNKSLKRQLEKSRRSGPRDDEFSRLLTGGSKKASRRVTIGAPEVIDEDMMMSDSFSTPSSLYVLCLDMLFAANRVLVVTVMVHPWSERAPHPPSSSSHRAHPRVTSRTS